MAKDVNSVKKTLNLKRTYQQEEIKTLLCGYISEL